MPSASVWLEGAHHPFEDQRRWYEEFLPTLGVSCSLVDQEGLFSPESQEADLWILGGLVYSDMEGGTATLSPERLNILRARLAEGKPILALHAVIGSWDQTPDLDEVWDGRWVWGQSRHSPIEPFPVKVSDPVHPAAQGLEGFEITDELYYALRNPTDSRVFLTADYEGEQWPLAWSKGSLIYLGLGHDLRSLENPSYGQVVGSAVRFLLRA